MDNPTWISNYICYKMRGEITYTLQNFWRFSLSKFWFVNVSVCRSFGLLSMFGFVDVSVSRHCGRQHFILSMFQLATSQAMKW